jgi:aspartyl-tRNA(Asn)/glutamyl-tRNA(Gln) amidotransferase subunit B
MIKTVIGLEMHCELKSNSKVFSSGKNSYNELSNANVSPVDMAFPGTLPVLNKKCVEHAIKMALVLNCDIAPFMLFDRKNYYYPDLPKGYQITQCTMPVGTKGYTMVEANGKSIKVNIHDIHLEEDAASLDHFFETSTIDYNRAGVPLIEVVTEPDFESADEAVAFLEHMRNIYKYCGISDADTKMGQIRCDVNVNLKEDDKFITPRVEIKNVNSFANVRATIEAEAKRQMEAIENGKKEELVQETRRYDETSNTTIRMRTKVDAVDYKYFVDPNIPPYKISQEWIQDIKKTIPVLPLELKHKYLSLGLDMETTLIIVKDKMLSDYFEECLKLKMNPKITANWLTINIVAELNKNEKELKDFYLTPSRLKVIVDNLENGNISSKQAKEIFAKSLEEEKEPSAYISKDSNQISDEETIKAIIKQVLDNNTDNIKAYKEGRTNLFDYFVGQIMKETRGKANPALTKKLLASSLDER